jgi:hypothetical protein
MLYKSYLSITVEGIDFGSFTTPVSSLVVFSRCLLASRSDLGARPRREAIKRRNDGEETFSELPAATTPPEREFAVDGLTRQRNAF